MTSKKGSKSFKESLILQGLVMRGKCAEGEDGPFLEVSFFCDG